MSSSVWVRALIRIEKAGNRLPDPVMLFLWLIALVILVSAICSAAGLTADHPVNGETLTVKSLLSFDALRWWLSNGVKTFMNFAPVGPVVVVMLGLGIAEHSGYLSAALRRLLLMVPGTALTFGTVLVGVLSSIAFDAGYVVAIPLSGLIFSLAGRSPLVGMAACFAGVSGGFSANLLVGPVDAILGGITTEAAALIDSSVRVTPLANYYFMIVSVFMISGVATLVTQRWVEPAMSSMSLTTEDTDSEKPSQVLSDQERKALRYSTLLMIAFFAGSFLLAFPEGAPLRDPETGSLARSPFLSGLVLIIAIGAAIAGITYGRMTKAYNSSRDVVEGMESAVKTLAGYLVLMFFAAQFVALFSWSNLGAVAAVNGAALLESLELPLVLNLIMFVLLAASVNLMIGSASAKWAVLAPVFVPMLMLNGIPPEVTQAAYRIGDSSTNIITPLMPYFPLVVALMQKYSKDVGIGTLLAIMLPYSISFLVLWSLMLALWTGFGWPLGPA